MIAEGRCPIQALARLAERAEAEGDLPTAIAAWRAVVPYVHARPKPVESDPDGVVQLAQALKAAAVDDAHQMNFAEHVERMVREMDRAA